MIPQDTVQRAIEQMKRRRANYEYFFSKVNNPAWIPPLAERGFFTSPPEVVREKGYIRLPVWPESQFLARVAAEAPTIVVGVFLRMPATDNARVYEDMAKAALAMPADIAIQLSGVLTENATLPYSASVPELLSELAVKYYGAGYGDQATRLLSKLLALSPQDSGSEPVPRFSVIPGVEQFQYEPILRKVVSELVPIAGIEALKLLQGVAVEYIELRFGSSDEANDFSSLDRPAIEDHPQNWHPDLLNPIINAVRDAAAALVESTSLTEVISALEEPKVLILRRVAMHLIACAQNPSADLVSNYLANRGNFESTSMHHEYFVLTERHFGKLSPSDQAMVLAWIDEENDPEEMKQLSRKFGSPYTDEQAREAASYQRFSKLIPLRTHLTGARKTEFQQLLEHHGTPEHPDLLSFTGDAIWGSRSPLSADELAAMTPGAIVEYLRTWQPGGFSFDTPSVEGLAGLFEAQVKSNPHVFVGVASLLKGLDPTYLRHFLSGIHEAIRNGIKINWTPVLDLASWVIAQAEDVNRKSYGFTDKDPDGGWTRREIASLLVSGLESRSVEPEIGLRNVVWQILAVLANDADPTPEHEATYGGGNMDPFTLSLNTTRGAAMRAVVLYTLWVYRCTPSGEFSMRTVPEAELTLWEHLDVRSDPSLAVRSVYGFYAPWLAMMDEPWFLSRMEDIFDKSVGKEAYWYASWNSYITYCRPFDEMLRVLESEYRHAIDDSTQGNRETFPTDAVKSLGVHLLVFYGRKQLHFAEGSLLNYYLDHTAPDARHVALRDLGLNFYHNASNISRDLSLRYVPLWDLLVERAAARSSAQRQDLTAFGSWFTSGVLPMPWGIRTLVQVLELTSSIEHAHVIIEKLANYASEYPTETLRSLELMFKQGSNRMYFSFEREEINVVLRHALASEANEKATDFIHLLAAAGIQWYGELLKESKPSVSDREVLSNESREE